MHTNLKDPRWKCSHEDFDRDQRQAAPISQTSAQFDITEDTNKIWKQTNYIQYKTFQGMMLYHYIASLPEK